MKTTKKQIKEATKSKKGQRFSGPWSFSTDIKINGKDYFFEKPFQGRTGVEVYVSYKDENDVLQTDEIGTCDYKDEYIKIVQDYINNL